MSQVARERNQDMAKFGLKRTFGTPFIAFLARQMCNCWRYHIEPYICFKGLDERIQNLFHSKNDNGKMLIGTVRTFLGSLVPYNMCTIQKVAAVGD